MQVKKKSFRGMYIVHYFPSYRIGKVEKREKICVNITQFQTMCHGLKNQLFGLTCRTSKLILVYLHPFSDLENLTGLQSNIHICMYNFHLM
jgi:hypothetical protein